MSAPFDLTPPPGRVSEPPPSRRPAPAAELPAEPRTAAWACRGYMVPHGFRAGRMWFVCSACRWKF